MREEKNNFQDETLKKKKSVCGLKTTVIYLLILDDLPKVFKLHGNSFLKVSMIHLH